MANEFSLLVSGVRAAFQSGRTRPLEWRVAQLEALLRMVEDNAERLKQCLWKDLRRAESEAEVMEVGYVRNEIVGTLNSIEDWVKPEKVAKTLLTLADSGYIESQPLGVVLIIGAWNYSLMLTVLPLIGAIAAGNCAVIKPSELATEMASCLEELVLKYMDSDCVKIVNGGVPATTALLKERFDKIFYTGGSSVGRVVLQAAALHLTPTTLELGGKSPVYVHPSSDLRVAARRIVWGRYVNAGQTCIAPDYVLCSSGIQTDLVAEMRKALQEFYGEDVQKSDDFARIINDRHFERVLSLVEGGGSVAIGGRSDRADRFIEPTVLIDVKPTDACMRNEIFGPVLPIMTAESVQDAIDFITSQEKPLAMYVFSRDDDVTTRMLDATSCGGVTVNDVLFHSVLPTLPFGGVGNSGMGAYHGKFSFDTFSHRRSVMVRGQGLEAVNTLRYPPYSLGKLKQLRFATHVRRNFLPRPLAAILPYVILGLLSAIIMKMVNLGRYLNHFFDTSEAKE